MSGLFLGVVVGRLSNMSNAFFNPLCPQPSVDFICLVPASYIYLNMANEKHIGTYAARSEGDNGVFVLS